MLVQNIAGLFIPPHDYISLTYVTSGNGVGEIETVTFKENGASGQTVAILTLGYDATNKLISVERD